MNARLNKPTGEGATGDFGMDGDEGWLAGFWADGEEFWRNDRQIGVGKDGFGVFDGREVYDERGIGGSSEAMGSPQNL